MHSLLYCLSYFLGQDWVKILSMMVMVLTTSAISPPPMKQRPARAAATADRTAACSVGSVRDWTRVPRRSLYT